MVTRLFCFLILDARNYKHARFTRLPIPEFKKKITAQPRSQQCSLQTHF